MKKVLVFGATGATGMPLVTQLLANGVEVIAAVRDKHKLPDTLLNHPQLTVHQYDVSMLKSDALNQLILGVSHVVCCLGYDLTWQGVFFSQKQWLSQFIIRLLSTIENLKLKEQPRVILMNTTGNVDRTLGDKPSLFGRMILKLLYLLLPPHRDNILAAQVLRQQDLLKTTIPYCIVRPSGLLNEDNISDYQMTPNNEGCPIKNDGRVSRINVANFINRLVVEDNLWESWQGKMPVLANTVLSSKQVK